MSETEEQALIEQAEFEAARKRRNKLINRLACESEAEETREDRLFRSRSEDGEW